MHRGERTISPRRCGLSDSSTGILRPISGPLPTPLVVRVKPIVPTSGEGKINGDGDGEGGGDGGGAIAALASGSAATPLPGAAQSAPPPPPMPLLLLSGGVSSALTAPSAHLRGENPYTWPCGALSVVLSSPPRLYGRSSVPLSSILPAEAECAETKYGTMASVVAGAMLEGHAVCTGGGIDIALLEASWPNARRCENFKHSGT
eukprot:SAG11_NODE_609_length_8224_cov_5.446154_2_plen_204_part_00